MRLGIVGALFLSATLLLIVALRDSLVFFISPGELLQDPPPTERVLRLGGVVVEDSVVQHPHEIRFRLHDPFGEVEVRFSGSLPDLFRENQAAVARGTWHQTYFRAQEVLAKHDEYYMPPEVAETMRRSGRWRGPVE